MKIADRNGVLNDRPDGQERMLSFFYGTIFGRLLLKLLTRPFISKIAGRFLSTRASCFLIKSFIRKHQIDMALFQKQKYRSYNEFFSREILPQMRPIDQNPDHLISPCDSKLTVLPIGEDTRLVLKNTPYTVSSLLQNDQMAEMFSGGYALIFRLTVDDYHRYCHIADGTREPSVKIKGKLHTVNPIANDYYPIYKENSREYTLIHSACLGDYLMMEVGALLVGRIVNHPNTEFLRGQEKGYFQFGGSTVVVLLKANVANPDEDILRNSENGIETKVQMGEKIGIRIM